MDAIVKDVIISLAVELGWLGAPVVRTHLDGWGRQLSVRSWMAGGASCPYALGWLGAPVVRTLLDGWGRQLSVRRCL
jgi:hypothetical protein